MNTRPRAQWSTSAVAVLALAALLPAGATAQDSAPLPSPEPVAALPNAERPLTHDELLDVRGASTQNGWDGAMLVADTVIDRRARTRPPGEMGRGIAFGSLPRADHPDQPAVEARNAVRAFYPADDNPVSGLLAVELLGHSMQLWGTVATPNGTYHTPIEPASMALAGELPTGSLIVAEGWLSQLRGQASCPPIPRALDRNDNGGAFSPFVRCPGGWLTATQVTMTDPADPLSPDVFGIPVQHGALERFTRPRSSPPVEQPATYVLQHVANPVVGGEPPTAWEIIGRLDPTTDRAVKPAPTTDAVTPAGLDWQASLERQPSADGWWTHSTAWANGFASVHSGRDRVLSSWVSPDGTAWNSAALPRRIGSVSALLQLHDGLVLIANERRFDAIWRFETWTSRDGLEWKRAGRQSIRTPAPFEGGRRRVHGFWSLGDRIVALETHGENRCCGRTGDRVFLAGPRVPPDQTYTWSSTDASDWTRRRTAGVPRLAADYLGSHISGQGDELLVMWGDPKRTLGRSRDGVTWRVAGAYPAELSQHSRAVLARTANGFVVAGEPSESTSGEGSDLNIWRSTANGEWQRTYERSSGVAESVAVVGDTVIIAGSRLDLRDPSLDPPPDVPWLLVSRDGGATWDAALSWTGQTDWCLRDLTQRDRAVVLDAVCAPPEAASKYVVTLNPEVADLPAAVPTPRQALDCDARGKTHSVRNEWGDLSGFSTPAEALRDVLREGFVIPVRGYRVLERNDTRILYGFRNGREVKVAIRVAATDDGRWLPEWLADCQLAEFGRNADMGPGIWLWADRDGRTIQEQRGPAHCRQQSNRVLWWRTATDKQRRHTFYVRDPEGQFREQWQAPYLRSTTLPADARNTGYRRDGATIWMAADEDSIYIKRGREVQRWPRIPGNALGCA